MKFFASWFQKPTAPVTHHLPKAERARVQDSYKKAVAQYNRRLVMMKQWCKVLNYDPTLAERKEQAISKLRAKHNRHFIRHKLA